MSKFSILIALSLILATLSVWAVEPWPPSGNVKAVGHLVLKENGQLNLIVLEKTPNQTLIHVESPKDKSLIDQWVGSVGGLIGRFVVIEGRLDAATYTLYATSIRSTTQNPVRPDNGSGIFR